MRKQIVFSFALLIVAISITAIASAETVNLEISTYANYDVAVLVLNPSQEDPVATLQGTSGSNGKAYFNFTTSINKVDLSVTVRKNGHIVVFKKFEGYTPIGNIGLSILKPEDSAKITPQNNSQNSTQPANQTAADNSTNATAPNITGAATTNSSEDQTADSAGNSDTGNNDSNGLLKIIAITLGGVFILFVIAGIILFLVLRKRAKNPKEIKVRKYSEIKDEIAKEKPKTGDEKKIAELEGKIKGLQDEVDEIKNKKSKIKEVEDRIKQDMKELDRLKKDSE
jgi:hypothetical protein